MQLLFSININSANVSKYYSFDVCFSQSVWLCSSVKYLGLLFDQHNDWQIHVWHIRAKCRMELYLLKMLAQSAWGLCCYYAEQLIMDAPSAPLLLDQHWTHLTEHTTKELDYVLGHLYHPQERSTPINMHQAVALQSDNSSAIIFGSQIAFLHQLIIVHCFPYEQLDYSPPYVITVLPPLTEMSSSWLIRWGHSCLCMPYLANWSITKPESLWEDVPVLEDIRGKGACDAIYTDGSESNSSVARPVLHMIISIQLTLPKWAAVHTADRTAIQTPVDMISETGQSYSFIFSDSCSAEVAPYVPANCSGGTIYIISLMYAILCEWFCSNTHLHISLHNWFFCS